MNILTFDIEDWFHLLDHDSTRSIESWGKYPSRVELATHNILDLLDTHNLSATFFCLGWVAEKYPRLIKEIAKRGHDIGSHSYSHQLVYQQNKTSFEEDLKKSLILLEDLIGKKIISYRAPGFSITKNCLWAFEILNKYGILIDNSIFPAARGNEALSSFPDANPCIINYGDFLLKEFPMNTVSLLGRKMVFSGGGYFRILPYPVIKHFMNKSKYVMTYFHPRDFDPAQPVLEDLPKFRKFKSYYGLNGSFDKLKFLLQDFNFINLTKAVSKINWDEVKTIKL